MKCNWKGGLAAVVLAALCSPAQAGSAKDVVYDKYGNFVLSTFGDCVRTKWAAAHDKCAAEPEKAAPVRTYMKEHNRSYLVFFDWDHYNLTDDAKSIIAELIDRTDGAAKAQFDIVGHADRSGSDAYNIRLSQKRANSVKQQLIRLGAIAGNIALDWKGESAPLVPTEDGIREPQNRRASISVSTQEKITE